MCQLCDEAEAYLAQLEAKAKQRAEEQRKADPSADKDSSRKAAAVTR